MKLLLTGGGTGGHIYPALEVGREAANRGAVLSYMGSLRGQEGAACERLGIPFTGFASEPLWSLKTPQGWKALAKLLRATSAAKRALRGDRPDVVFSTGGYSAGPVMAAARALGIPYLVHEANSIPGRTTKMFAPQAAGVTCTFKTTVGRLPNVVRTGHPIRRELREAALEKVDDGSDLVLVLGGSQGAKFLNEGVPKAAQSFPAEVRWLHATGPNQFDPSQNAGANYELVPYLELDRIVAAYREARVAVARGGSTLAEFAAFRLPSVIVPLPTSADDHQRHNALEFQAMGAGILCEQPDGDLVGSIRTWFEDDSKRQAAKQALAEWDIPDATRRLATIIEEAARKNA